MKRILLGIAALIISHSYAEAAVHQSPLAIKLSNQLVKNRQKDDKIMQSKMNVSAIVKINQFFDFQKAKTMGVKLPTTSNNIASAKIPINKYLEFVALPGIDYIEIGGFASPAMDSARAVAHIQEVIDGVGLPKQYSGDGVIIGIVDAGFDYTHPAFYDKDNSQLAISRVWEQGVSGTAPTGFEYGREFIGTDAILAIQRDIDGFTHGTHVAGIAAGRAVEGAEQYQGIASKSELVFVALAPPSQENWMNTSGGDIIDAVNYIFQYAESVGKPSVVNLSWGGQIGPHDGTSLFSQAIDGLVDAGKIFVCSAGNDGGVKLHLDKTFSDVDSMLVSYIVKPKDLSLTPNGIWLDCWGEEGKPFEFKFEIVNQSTLTPRYSSEYLSTAADTSFEYKFIDGVDTCDVSVTINTSPFNNKPHAFVSLMGENSFWLRLNAKAKEGRVQAWNWYLIDYYGIERPFVSKNDKISVAGNTTTTISDFASTKRAIAVGAMVSKNSYTNLKGSSVNLGGYVGYIAPFSSIGPTADGRVKPDIVAPGMGLAASVSSYDSGYADEGKSASMVVTRVNKSDKSYPYAVLSGTSMSSPTASGAIALLLSANPALTPEEVIELLKKSADSDDFTGELPNPKWGNGRLNLLNAMKQLLGIVAVEQRSLEPFSVYPNPFSEFINIEDINISNVRLEIINQLGNIVYSQNINEENTVISNLNLLAQGIYILKISKSGKILLQTTAIKSE